jgi:hypothetical protein
MNNASHLGCDEFVVVVTQRTQTDNLNAGKPRFFHFMVDGK